MSFLDCNGALIPYTYESWKDANREGRKLESKFIISSRSIVVTKFNIIVQWKILIGKNNEKEIAVGKCYFGKLTLLLTDEILCGF